LHCESEHDHLQRSTINDAKQRQPPQALKCGSSSPTEQIASTASLAYLHRMSIQRSFNDCPFFSGMDFSSTWPYGDVHPFWQVSVSCLPLLAQLLLLSAVPTLLVSKLRDSASHTHGASWFQSIRCASNMYNEAAATNTARGRQLSLLTASAIWASICAPKSMQPPLRLLAMRSQFHSLLASSCRVHFGNSLSKSLERLLIAFAAIFWALKAIAAEQAPTQRAKPEWLTRCLTDKDMSKRWLARSNACVTTNYLAYYDVRTAVVHAIATMRLNARSLIEHEMAKMYR
jgi:hypothetical protein